MTELIPKIKDWVNLGVVPVIGLLIFSSLLIFLPESTIQDVGLEALSKEYKVHIGLVFLFSIAFLVAYSLNAIWSVFLGTWLREKASLYFLKKEANDLTEEEKELLKGFVENRTRSMNLSMKNGVVLGLEKRQFIIRTGNLGTDALSMSFPYAIQPWAWEYLNKHPELLE
ncbi:superinfection exclusion B family protein [Marinobacter sp.]|uniref:superinfection exclusion B family protein n=1 Tax=Marinobacter sp. TaxID=50741 RepID=UPI002584D882|nr:superinfection exclusion B family protein [Marinobacter sp.]MCW9011045.1 superinfection exclusion B family protein [Marinobacter sp.]